MNLVNTYNLVYSGMTQPQHLLETTKASIAANALSQTQNAQLAEFFLRELDTFNLVSRKQRQFSVGNERVSAEQKLNYVQWIHFFKEKEIRERFLPEISEDEAMDLLFKMELEQELEDIPKRIETSINI